jgi:hypothetical protein
MPFETDLLVVDALDTPVAAIEVKNHAKLEPPQAAMIRRNLFAHGLVPLVDYFMLVSQDVGYLWGPAKREAIAAEPDLSFSMSPVLQRYSVEPTGAGRLFNSQLELLVSSWIQELTSGVGRAEDEPELSLERAGFTAAVRRGKVLTEARP